MEPNRRNYYRILHVQPEAPEAVIRASYRTIMQRLKAHPDLGGDPAFAALLNEAYAVLTDPVRRAAYDAQLGQRPRRRAGASAGAAAGAGAGAGGPGANATAGPAPPPREPPRPADRQPPAKGGRRIPRVARRHAALLHTGGEGSRGAPADVLDLSPLGVRFTTAATLVVGQLARLESDAFHAVVRVTSVQRDPADGRWSVGCAFVSVVFDQPRGSFVSLQA